MKRYQMIKARHELGLTQEQVGRIVGVSKSSIAMYETGERKPKLKTILALSGLLGLPVEKLLERG